LIIFLRMVTYLILSFHFTVIFKIRRTTKKWSEEWIYNNYAAEVVSFRLTTIREWLVEKTQRRKTDEE
jgi:hypothetical protein